MTLVHSAPATTAVTRLSELASAVERAASLEEVVGLRTQAEAFAVWCKTKEEGQRLTAAAHRVVLIAERRLGELSAKLPKKSSRWGRHPSKKAALQAVGVYPKRARDAEKLAAIPQAKFEEFLRTEKPTVGSALKEFGVRRDYPYPAAVKAWRSIAYEALDLLDAALTGALPTRSAVAELRRRCRLAVSSEGSGR